MKEITVSSRSIFRVIEANGEVRTLLLDEYEVVDCPNNCLKITCTGGTDGIQDLLPIFVIPNGSKLSYHKNEEIHFDEFWDSKYSCLEVGLFNSEGKQYKMFGFKQFDFENWESDFPFYKISIPDDCKLYVCDSSKDYIVFFARIL